MILNTIYPVMITAPRPGGVSYLERSMRSMDRELDMTPVVFTDYHGSGAFETWLGAARIASDVVNSSTKFQRALICEDDAFFVTGARGVLEDLQMEPHDVVVLYNSGYRHIKPEMIHGSVALLFGWMAIERIVNSNAIETWSLGRAADQAVTHACVECDLEHRTLSPGIVRHIGERSCFHGRDHIDRRGVTIAD